MTQLIGTRNCCRCGKDLTDAASLEVGIGPICRKLDNALLARLIAANVPAALVTIGTVVVSSLPEVTHATYANVLADLAVEGNDDWRKTAKRIEWILSWRTTEDNRNALVQTIEDLGYVGLAALISGDAATGKAVVTLEGGRLHLRGPRNRSGQAAIMGIPGRRFHSATDGVKASWSVPVAAGEAFRLVVAKHWPNFSGLEEAIASAVSEPAAAPVVVVATLNDAGWLQIKTPYNAAFVGEIKTLPYRSRRWNGDARVWEVEPSLFPQVSALVSKHYPDLVAVRQ
jgi:hypothetical protein